MGKVVIICEGAEDVNFLKALVSDRGLNGFEFQWDYEFKGPRMGGVTNFHHMIRSVRTQTAIKGEIDSILIVADNDGEPKRRFQLVQTQITKADCAAPDNPRIPEQQTDLPPITVLMIPWDDDTGCLETLCLLAAQKSHPELIKCVDDLVGCVKLDDWDVAKIAKLRMRCYLSSICKNDPNTGLSYAWTGDRMPQNPIPIKDGCFNQIADFLQSLTTIQA